MQRIHPKPGSPHVARMRRHWLVLALAAACILIELALSGAERGLWGSARWRLLSYLNGGFWAGLLRAGWEGNYPLQPVAMFFSHAFLHAGFMHLATNVIALLGLAAAVRARAGQGALALVLAAAALGGGLAFAIFGPLGQPMVGASGAIFGLAGALMVWQAQADRRDGRGPWSMLGLAAALMALNLLSAWLVGWQMAWEAHAGGFVAGALAAVVVGPRPGAARRGGAR